MHRGRSLGDANFTSLRCERRVCRGASGHVGPHGIVSPKALCLCNVRRTSHVEAGSSQTHSVVGERVAAIERRSDEVVEIIECMLAAVYKVSGGVV